MAKKKEPLTPEERLQAALVPDGEQPYKVPENWCWTYPVSYTHLSSTPIYDCPYLKHSIFA